MTPKDQSQAMRTFCANVPVIPVLVIDDPKIARPLAEALVEGGLPVLEVTLRTPAALPAIEAMAQVPGVIVGAGTLRSIRDVELATSAGAQFGVSPGCTTTLVKASEYAALPLLPGASTASEVMSLSDCGYDMLKFFPAEASGGVKMMDNLAGPFPEISFCPTGGITKDNFTMYMACPTVRCVGGSWIATRNMIRDHDWCAVRQNAQETCEMAKANEPHSS
ncbi:MAG: bifunctional 4-hydroxy-2-oxoglutarate aldolase/2-dehydro-3-deoxy-phosphogluconate aldolase [Pseudomonadota bacterium]